MVTPRNLAHVTMGMIWSEIEIEILGGAFTGK